MKAGGPEPEPVVGATPQEIIEKLPQVVGALSRIFYDKDPAVAAKELTEGADSLEQANSLCLAEMVLIRWLVVELARYCGRKPEDILQWLGYAVAQRRCEAWAASNEGG